MAHEFITNLTERMKFCMTRSSFTSLLSGYLGINTRLGAYNRGFSDVSAVS